jgi:predicted RNA-binding Zn ribbon-like protein
VVRTIALVESSVQPGGRAPAPAGLELVQAFVNTVDREHGPDLLDTAEHWRAWCERRGLKASAREEAREVREALRTLLWRDGGENRAAAVLDAAAKGLQVRFGPARVEGATAVDAVLAQAFVAMTTGEWDRLKACPGHNCGWAFYDRSANASATWCSMRVCGNRAKTRAYYARRR